jgi:hypothetical protein
MPNPRDESVSVLGEIAEGLEAGGVWVFVCLPGELFA